MLRVVLTSWLVTSACFFAIRLLPGDPVDVLLSGARDNLNAQSRASAAARLGIESTGAVQYVRWLGHMTTGDLGESFYSHQHVIDLIVARAPSTAGLILVGLALSIGLGLPLGTVAAVSRGRFADATVVTLATVAEVTPRFLVAALAIELFSVRLGWLPSVGGGFSGDGPVSALAHLALPALALSLGLTGMTSNMCRAAVLSELDRPYVLVARAKGVSELGIIWRHVLKNSAMSLVTVLGAWTSTAFSNVVVVESIFARPGLGQLLYQAILNRDYPVVQGVVLIAAVLVVAVKSWARGVERLLLPSSS